MFVTIYPEMKKYCLVEHQRLDAQHFAEATLCRYQMAVLDDQGCDFKSTKNQTRMKAEIHIGLPILDKQTQPHRFLHHASLRCIVRYRMSNGSVQNKAEQCVLDTFPPTPPGVIGQVTAQ